MNIDLASLGIHLADALPRSVVLLVASLVMAHAFRHRTRWQHTMLFCALGAQIILVLHAALTPSLGWRILPQEAAPMVAPLTEVATSLGMSVPSNADPLPFAASMSATTMSLPEMIGLVWLIGALLLLLRIAIGHAVLRRHHVAAKLTTESAWALRKACEALRWNRRISVVFDDTADQPYAFGVLHAGIALPPAAMRWSAPEARAILAHEVAHIARGDLLANLIGHLAAALMWPNPLIHVARRRAEAVREQLADARAVSTGIAPSEYVTSVVGGIRELMATPSCATVPLAGQRHDLTRRMRAVLTPEVWRSGSGAASHAVTTVVTPVVGLASAALAVGSPVLTSTAMCDYRDGEHLDVRRPTSGQRTHWLVEWTGEQCQVTWRATGSATMDPINGTLILPAAHDSIMVSIRNGTAVRRLVAFRAAAMGIEYRVDNEPEPTQLPPTWLPGFLLELERHTAVGRTARVRALLARGGVPAVLTEASQMYGGHAAALYLTDLVATEPLNAGQYVQLLGLVSHAAAINDAALEQLLLAVVSRAPVNHLAVHNAFVAAMNRLGAVAARERIRSALSATITRRS